MTEPTDDDVLRAIRRVLSAAAAEMQLDRIITDEDCQHVIDLQRAEGMSNAEIVANAEVLLNAETILEMDDAESAH